MREHQVITSQENTTLAFGLLTVEVSTWTAFPKRERRLSAVLRYPVVGFLGVALVWRSFLFSGRYEKRTCLRTNQKIQRHFHRHTKMGLAF